MPEGQGGLVVLEPVGEIDGATSGQLADEAAQGSVDVTLTGHRKTYQQSYYRKRLLVQNKTSLLQIMICKLIATISNTFTNTNTNTNSNVHSKCQAQTALGLLKGRSI